jgi:hypothetical protein
MKEFNHITARKLSVKTANSLIKSEEKFPLDD